MITIDNFRNDDMFKADPKPTSLETILRSIILNFYYYNDKPICIDKNRGWTGYMEYIIKYINPNPKIICPVRDIKGVLTSFITLLRKNNYPKDSFIDTQLKHLENPTDDDRCRYLLGPGILGQSIVNLLDGVKNYPDNILLVDYDELVNNTDSTMKKIYDFLGEEYFQHSTKIKQSHTLNDKEVYKLEGMHTVRSKVEKTSPDPSNVLSEFMLHECDTNEVLQEYEKYRLKYIT